MSALVRCVVIGRIPELRRFSNYDTSKIVYELWRIQCVDVNNPIGTIHHIQSFGGHASGSHLKGMYKFPHGKVGLHKLEYALTKCPKCTKSTLSEGASLTLSIGGRWAQRSKNLTIGNGSVEVQDFLNGSVSTVRNHGFNGFLF